MNRGAFWTGMLMMAGGWIGSLFGEPHSAVTAVGLVVGMIGFVVMIVVGIFNGGRGAHDV